MSILEAGNLRALQHALRDQLQAIYPEAEANAMAQELLLHVLSVSKTQLSLMWHETVPQHAREQLQQFLPRLLQHEPLQYVLGKAHFYGMEFDVSPAVLIPRPETEELVDLIIKQNQSTQNLHILDIGTGSGCIPVALAAHLQTEKVFAVDVSGEALAVAQQNALNHQQKIEFIQADILRDEIPIAKNSLDILVSNPPYVLEGEQPQMRQNVLAHEPHLALFVPNHNPLLFYTKIAELGQKLLKMSGKLYFEINEQFGQHTVKMLEQFAYREVELLQDMFGKDRIVIAEK
ncbi:MAG: peptide chain release factor N(5)-glutamine methyltransferase [Hymenobacteraceae bacterium]|nr:peptide chain release factor N(5)-glutamine methyltransferase [Hymenobacteraceae bacterium]MDX5397628.1 peptide chain release factor N(5)-glutamine methyltransferase [Hymenobacteraceae bacterium]MDX5513705.1 peptide chain release factor N(5)-glutamine methyltransferase [Hymenobacteraceae bacterium]